MSKELNEAFVKDPVKFASGLPVLPPGGQAGGGKTKTYLDMPESFKGVPGAVRIIAANLEKRGCYADVQLTYDKVDEKIAQGWMAIYWLPWIANNCIRTTLRPRSETDRDEKIKTGNRAVTKLSQTNGYQKDPNDPDIFFTAAVDGCMVIVDGSPSQPTVYHANRKDLDTDTELGAKDDARIPQMIKDMGKFNAQRTKLPRGNSVLASAKPLGATAEMYMPHAQKSKVPDYDVLNDQEWKSFNKQLGSIFGFRQDAQWQFWYERLLRFDYKIKAFDEEEDEETGTINKRSYWDFQGPGYHLCELKQFWPDGNGHVVA